MPDALLFENMANGPTVPSATQCGAVRSARSGPSRPRHWPEAVVMTSEATPHRGGEPIDSAARPNRGP